VLARIFPLLVARHHNVDNLGSLAWSSPRHLAGAASLLFLTLATCVYKRIRTTFCSGFSGSPCRRVRECACVHGCVAAAAAQRCCAPVLYRQVRTVMPGHDAFLYGLFILICDSLACFRLQLTMRIKFRRLCREAGVSISNHCTILFNFASSCYFYTVVSSTSPGLPSPILSIRNYFGY